MVNAHRELLCGNVVSEHQIQLEHVPVLSGNRRDGVVRFSVCLSENKGRLVRVASPAAQHLIAQLNQAVRILGSRSQHRHGPLYNACLHVLKAGNCKIFLNRRLRHGEGIVSALEMIVGED